MTIFAVHLDLREFSRISCTAFKQSVKNLGEKFPRLVKMQNRFGEKSCGTLTSCGASTGDIVRLLPVLLHRNNEFETLAGTFALLQWLSLQQ